MRPFTYYPYPWYRPYTVWTFMWDFCMCFLTGFLWIFYIAYRQNKRNRYGWWM